MGKRKLSRGEWLVAGAVMLFTVAAVVGILDASARAMTPAPTPEPLQMETGAWAGWTLDAGWTVGADGDLVGDTSDTAAFPPQPLDDFVLRYAFPPEETGGDYQISFDLTLTRGTLYLGALADPAHCSGLVFPLADPLSGPAVEVTGCRMGDFYAATANALDRPYSAALYAGQPQTITLRVAGGQVQLITLDTVIYDVALSQLTAPQGSGAAFLAVGPQTEVRVTGWVMRPLE